jgi:hypothetical protein
MAADASTGKTGATSAGSRASMRARDGGTSPAQNANASASSAGAQTTSDADAGDRKDADEDAAVGDTASPTCDPASPFVDVRSALELFSDKSILEGLDIVDVRPTVDELDVFVSARRPQDGDCCNYDLYTAQRQSRSQPFETLRLLDVSTDDIEGDPSLSGDGLQLYFTRLNGQFEPSLWRASRTQLSKPFGEPVEIAGWWTDAGYSRETPFVSASGRTLFFSSLATGNGDLHRAELDARTLFADSKLAAVNSVGLELAPVLSPRQDVLYFASDRPTEGQDELNIWVATREGGHGPFAAPLNVRELNTSGIDIPKWLSADACRLIFSRSANSGQSELLVAERTP